MLYKAFTRSHDPHQDDELRKSSKAWRENDLWRRGAKYRHNKTKQTCSNNKVQRTEKLWLSCVFACSYAFEMTLNTAGRTRLVTPTRPTSRNSVFNQNTRTTFKVTTSDRERERNTIKLLTSDRMFSNLFYCILNQH